MTDIETPLKSRRAMLGLLGGIGATVIVAACGGSSGTAAKQKSSSTSSSSNPSTSSTTTAAASATATLTVAEEIPEETAGPFPGDGTNGPNVLTETGVVRSDIRSSIGDAKGVAAGVPLTIQLTMVDPSSGKARPGTVVYLWHCDQDGEYSMYGQDISEENYLRGVQVADANGLVTFTSIYPAAYSGRWPHIHFEMFDSRDAATDGANNIKVSQLALPAGPSNAVYKTDGYEQSASNLARTSLDSDMVFSDGVSLQTPTVTGDARSGFTAAMAVGV